MKIYISGKITGYDIEFAEAKFKKSEELIINLGHEPVNPMKVSPHTHGKTWDDYMKDDIRALLQCEAILLQKDWSMSKGANLEFAIAKAFNMHVLLEERFYPVAD